MFHLIGLGLNQKSISLEALQIIKKCKKVFLEEYTVKFPYTKKTLEKIIKKKIILIKREEAESLTFLSQAKKEDVALLVYGSPLSATTHITIIDECKKQKIPHEISYNAGIFDAIAETGLQFYKFGKIASMPRWQKNYEPDSFMQILLDNKKTHAHSLLLIDPHFPFREALTQFEKICKKNNLPIEKIIVCSKLGTKQAKIFYRTIDALKSKKINEPFCFIIPSKLHFFEEQYLKYSI
ncbi:MAG: diphthine synthase [Nanoarchaeota archaeon]